MRRSDGFLLPTTLLIAAVVAILVFGTMFTSMIDRTISANQQGASSSRYVAHAGLQHIKTLIFRHLTEYFAEEGEGWCDSPVAGGFTYGDISLNPNDPNARTTGWIDFGPGQYQVTLDLTDTYMVLTSVGRVGRSQSTAQLVATSGGGPSNAWDNAIFAEGTDPGAKAITGNVAVYGSVHIVLGEFEIEDDIFEDISVTGTAGIYNNYEGKNNPATTDIRNQLQALTGDRDVDLCSRVKIERGSIYLDSNASRVGTDNNPIYSVHLGDGNVYSGKKNANPQLITDHNDSARINLRYPVEGMNSGYDGFELRLPRLAPNYPNDIPGAISLQAAFEDGVCEWLFQDGKVKLPPSDPTEHTYCPQNPDDPFEDPEDPDTWPFPRIEWVPAVPGTPAHLRFVTPAGLIVGQSDEEAVIVNTGSFEVEIQGPVYYQGKGAIRSGGCLADNPRTVIRDGESIAVCNPDPSMNAKIKVEGDFTPIAGGYPDTHALGLVTTGNMDLGIDAQTTIAAVAYAGGTVMTDKQTLVVGSLVASKFDIGNQVPQVAWHKSVPEAASILRMPGAPSLDGEGSGGFAGDNPGVFRNISLEWREGPAGQ